jgi:hypothetical protein
MSAQQVIEALDRRIPSATLVGLIPNLGTRTFDVQRDVASLMCCRSAAALAIRLRWPSIVIPALSVGVSTLVIFALHWANGGWGQFAFAYAFPFWLEVWHCAGWWLTLGVLLLWYASLQRELAWMALKQFSTMWVIAMTGVLVAGWVSLYEFGVHKSTWVSLPVYLAVALIFPLIALADALPPKLRLLGLRFLGPFGLGSMAAVSLGLRLPTAEDTPGKLVWTVMGTDTVTNMQALTYSATVMTVLLAKGVFRAWVFPNQLAFVQASLCVAELAAHTSASYRPGPHAALVMAPEMGSDIDDSEADDGIALS